MNEKGLIGGFVELEEIHNKPDIIYLYNQKDTNRQFEGKIITIDEYQYNYYYAGNEESFNDASKKLVLNKEDGLYYDELPKIKPNIVMSDTNICDISSFDFSVKGEMLVKTAKKNTHYNSPTIKVSNINNNTITITSGVEISSGSYGVVLKYSDVSCNFAVKIGLNSQKSKDPLKKDIEIINYIKGYGGRSKCPDYYIKSHIIEYEQIGKKYIVMPLVEGPISKLYNKLSNENILIMIKTIIAELYCFYKMGLYYFDLKSENILYYIKEGGIKIVLGDLGSAIKKDDFDKQNNSLGGVYSYPPIGFSTDPSKNIAYGVGVILIQHIFGQRHSEYNSLVHRERTIGKIGSYLFVLPTLITKLSGQLKTGNEADTKLLQMATSIMNTEPDSRPTLKELYYDY